MIRLYDNHLSGNGYKPRLLLAHLGRSYERVEIDTLKGGSRTPEFLAMNPNGRIPVLRLEDGTCLAESNAILWYLAEGTPFLPADPLARALALQWMFFEQYSHEPNVAVGPPLAPARRDERSPARAASRKAGRRPGRARGHGAPSRAAVLVRRGGDDRRGRRPLRLYPRGGGGRLRSIGLSERHRLARPGGGAARGTSRCSRRRRGSSPRAYSAGPVPAQDHSAVRVASPGVWRGLRTSMAGTPGSPSPRMPGVDRSRRGRKFPRIRRSPNPA